MRASTRRSQREIEARRQAEQELQPHQRDARTARGRERLRASRSSKRPSAASAFWSRASPTTRSTCSIPEGNVVNWNPGAAAHQGLRAARRSSAAISRRFYTPEDRQLGIPTTRSGDGRQRDRKVRGRRLARAQGRQQVLGERRHQCDSRAPSGELIGFAKVTRDLTERRAAEERARQVAEDGRHRPAHRRRRARLQQSADHHHRQSRSAAAHICASPLPISSG